MPVGNADAADENVGGVSTLVRTLLHFLSAGSAAVPTPLGRAHPAAGPVLYKALEQLPVVLDAVSYNLMNQFALSVEPTPFQSVDWMVQAATWLIGGSVAVATGFLARGPLLPQTSAPARVVVPVPVSPLVPRSEEARARRIQDAYVHSLLTREDAKIVASWDATQRAVMYVIGHQLADRLCGIEKAEGVDALRQFKSRVEATRALSPEALAKSLAAGDEVRLTMTPMQQTIAMYKQSASQIAEDVFFELRMYPILHRYPLPRCESPEDLSAQTRIVANFVRQQQGVFESGTEEQWRSNMELVARTALFAPQFVASLKAEKNLVFDSIKPYLAPHQLYYLSQNPEGAVQTALQGVDETPARQRRLVGFLNGYVASLRPAGSLHVRMLDESHEAALFERDFAERCVALEDGDPQLLAEFKGDVARVERIKESLLRASLAPASSAAGQDYRTNVEPFLTPFRRLALLEEQLADARWRDDLFREALAPILDAEQITGPLTADDWGLIVSYREDMKRALHADVSSGSVDERGARKDAFVAKVTDCMRKEAAAYVGMAQSEDDIQVKAYEQAAPFLLPGVRFAVTNALTGKAGAHFTGVSPVVGDAAAVSEASLVDSLLNRITAAFDQTEMERILAEAPSSLSAASKRRLRDAVDFEAEVTAYAKQVSVADQMLGMGAVSAGVEPPKQKPYRPSQTLYVEAITSNLVSTARWPLLLNASQALAEDTVMNQPVCALMQHTLFVDFSRSVCTMLEERQSGINDVRAGTGPPPPPPPPPPSPHAKAENATDRRPDSKEKEKEAEKEKEKATGKEEASEPFWAYPAAKAVVFAFDAFMFIVQGCVSLKLLDVGVQGLVAVLQGLDKVAELACLVYDATTQVMHLLSRLRNASEPWVPMVVLAVLWLGQFEAFRTLVQDASELILAFLAYVFGQLRLRLPQLYSAVREQLKHLLQPPPPPPPDPRGSAMAGAWRGRPLSSAAFVAFLLA